MSYIICVDQITTKMVQKTLITVNLIEHYKFEICKFTVNLSEKYKFANLYRKLSGSMSMIFSLQFSQHKSISLGDVCAIRESECCVGQ